MSAQYHIIGGFQKTSTGATTLHYGVSGEVGIPFMHAAINVIVLLVFTFFLGLLAFNSSFGGNWISMALFGVLLATTVGYTWYAYRSYRGHLNELNRFMEAFARSILAD